MEAVNGEKQKEMSERNREREHTCIDNIIITKATGFIWGIHLI